MIEELELCGVPPEADYEEACLTLEVNGSWASPVWVSTAQNIRAAWAEVERTEPVLSPAPRHRLTDEDACRIRELFATGTVTKSHLARMHAVDPSTIRAVISGKTHNKSVSEMD
ncbi:hypothetical protein [Micromonospora zamorensis]|uniref:hypothetical protein n=1 Tax=Micromonospora zamorensis TaxID=709883 RepID=UPI00081FC3EF|nr:hypothetical protein [Micromonospora zamorensis]SCG38173.1 hypothetical protein GA0070619_0612 [Micromonospora zamorensis]